MIIPLGIMIFRRKLIIGEMIKVMGEFPPKVGRIKKRRIMVPYLFKAKSTCLDSFSGKRPTKILPPSKG